jgi:L-lysine exporter family protein LysE/ArgO
MIGALPKGFATGAALIVAIGSQNAFVLRQGLRREHVLPLVAFCALSDAALIFAGIGGAGALIRSNVQLLDITRYGGALFLGSYGVLAARRACSGGHMQLQIQTGSSVQAALAACFAFTFLNPHVYLDTVVLVGSVANQQGGDARWWFGAGAALASIVWFSALGYGARLLAPWFEKDVAWRVLDSLIAVVMLLLAGSLLFG